MPSLLLVPEARNVVRPQGLALLARHVLPQCELFGRFFGTRRAIQSAVAGQLYKHRGVVIVVGDQVHQRFSGLSMRHNGGSG